MLEGLGLTVTEEIAPVNPKVALISTIMTWKRQKRDV
jgi:hypothetical protein